MVKIIAISGSGNGAGKSTLAKILSNPVWSLAGGIRQELKTEIPGYDWDNTTQAYKDKVKVKERDDKTVRTVMIEHGQKRCKNDPSYWIKKLCNKIENGNVLLNQSIIAIDDVRKVVEIEYLKARFPTQVQHFHIKTAHAVKEKEFDNDVLEEMADYVLEWNKKQ